LNTIRYLSEAGLSGLYWPGVVTGGALAMLCSMLSVLVVLKRLAFIGQGVSHAAFGGVGVVALLGMAGSVGAGVTVAQFAIIFAFCLASAVLIGWLSDRGGTEADTAIGIVLVASMAIGAILIHRSRSGVSWETFLFGSILGVGWADAGVAWGVALGVTMTLWWTRRRLVFWAFDPVVARAMGVSDRKMTLLLMALLALATVTAMKLAGVVLATALLVLPGAIALRLSTRYGVVMALAAGAALAGVVGGLVLSFELDWPTGPSIVCVLAGMFAIARGVEGVRAGRVNAGGAA